MMLPTWPHIQGVLYSIFFHKNIMNSQHWMLQSACSVNLLNKCYNNYSEIQIQRCYNFIPKIIGLCNYGMIKLRLHTMLISDPIIIVVNIRTGVLSIHHKNFTTM